MVAKRKPRHKYVSLHDFLCDELGYRQTDADFLRESYPAVGRDRFKQEHLDNLEALRSLGIKGKALRKLIRYWPQIVLSAPLAKFKEIERVYNVSRGRAVKAVLGFPPFAGLDHVRVLKGVEDVYGVSRARAVKAVLGFPQFAGLDHVRVLKGVEDVYGVSRARAVKAVLLHPQFAGYDHVRVLKGLVKRGRRLAGLSERQVKDLIVDHPFLAGYRGKRFDSFVEIAYDNRGRLREGVSLEDVRDWMLERPRTFFYSPYARVRLVDGTEKRMGYRQARRLVEAGKAGWVKKPTFLGTLEKRFILPPRPPGRPRKQR